MKWEYYRAGIWELSAPIISQCDDADFRVVHGATLISRHTNYPDAQIAATKHAIAGLQELLGELEAGEKEDCGASPGEQATRRWLPDKAEFDRFVDGIIEKAEAEKGGG